jgi:hypothetical protein
MIVPNQRGILIEIAHGKTVTDIAIEQRNCYLSVSDAYITAVEILSEFYAPKVHDGPVVGFKPKALTMFDIVYNSPYGHCLGYKYSSRDGC